jgi:hypothetical protein
LQANESTFAIASDLWTSKNSVYAFTGTVAFWIDENWQLQERLLELLPLSGDHSGKASEKLIFKALHRRRIETKLSKCTKLLWHKQALTYFCDLQVQMVPIMLPAMVHLTTPSANVFEKSVTSVLMLRICRLDVGGTF